MSYPTIASAGVNDQVFLRRLRNFLEDWPVFSAEQGSPNGANTEYRLTNIPVYDGDPLISIVVGNTTQTIVTSRSALTGANQVFLDYETGWMFWNPANPPPQGSNTLQARKYKVRWRDEKLMEALYTGLRLMFPRVWQKATDTSITLVTNQWDYTLPSVFNDPRVPLHKVELQEVPSTLERFKVVTGWRRIGSNILQIPWSNTFTPGSTLRLSFCGPYQTLGDLEDQLTPLPLWYAKGFLLTNKEIVRVRQDTANITQQETANPVGAQQNAGAFYLQQFENALNRLKKPMPGPPVLASYAQ